jgi:hypothetical protein
MKKKRTTKTCRKNTFSIEQKENLWATKKNYTMFAYNNLQASGNKKKSNRKRKMFQHGSNEQAKRKKNHLLIF